MRKVLIFALIVAIALSGLGFAHTAISDSQDDLLVYPTLEVGDCAILEGRTASMVFTCGEHLRWHTDYTFGGETATKFVYDRKGTQPPQNISRNRLDVWFTGGMSSSTSGGEFSVNSTDYASLLKAVAEVTPDGGSRTLTLRLKDYVNHYLPDYDLFYENGTIYVSESANLHSLICGGGWYSEMGSYRALMQKFRFPIQEGDTMAVTVDKDDAGRIVGIGLSPEYAPDLHFMSDLNDDGIWFVPVFRDVNGAPLPYESPAGHGIYFIPWQSTDVFHYVDGQEYPMMTPDVKNAELLFPLEDTLQIEHMVIDAETGEAWMLTLEDGSYILTSYDLHAGAVNARLEVLPHNPEQISNSGHFVRDGDYILITAQDQIALVNAATRELLLTAPDTMQEYDCTVYTPENGDLRYDGESLFLLDTVFYRDGAFWAAVFRQGELVCYGEYDCSLLRGNDDWYYSYIAIDEYPITWK